ncbi:phosphoribosylformylglycinamidine cyclo-ligase [Deinococcus peraridilitoris]|uniref:Phosphoribosylformylglycinamidine cyclo-ligase n=1 Tax=Deinococcus peraridilitoris (strain DSM 19664 / LMG 22246 / CIP 109416 / KR-200) TaxID=937777 RepID=L0A6A9_DEIPD|nr:phosphoribosylformylglycinamidine cyclo-ligase [Deinococcus peraridilitoris]AFZ68697.1 phosphoribosylaminoimidazole synthetase [Deinococcus peraridilitoris DSM 19664]
MAHSESGNPETAYKRAGVDIDAGARAVELMKASVARTHTPDVLAGLGSFGGLFRARALTALQDPVLVASTDGVGTKTKVATRARRFAGLGADIVNHCVNDILVQGARPLFFLDYVAMGKLDPQVVAEFVGGAARACEALAVALLGGETAEMPGVYVEGELDIVGTIVGAVDRAAIVDGSRLQEGDVLIGLPSTGLHTNGYSLARAALADLDWQEFRSDIDNTLEEALLAPHRAYVGAYDALLGAGVEVRGMAHLTGGGLVDNPPRVFPDGLGAVIWEGSWPVPPLFTLICERAGVPPLEAYRALNMGLGFLFMVPAAQREAAEAALLTAGEAPCWVGELRRGRGVAFEVR